VHDDDFWPADRTDAETLVAVLVGEIRQSDEADRDELLGLLLERAWPTRQALRK
jgi:hypothetical protein